MEFGEIVVHFNILDAMKIPSEDESVFRAEILDFTVDVHVYTSHSLHDKNHFLSSHVNASFPCTKHESETIVDIDSTSKPHSCSESIPDVQPDTLGLGVTLCI
ncbi:hypothetical protein LR48_Vigan05g083300 [Vigna angularis]|uniref:Uncharacterized protein n=1 Tax=Phaseolus angularis TaxID=3914 RepID=A0A0L9UKZ3_PHAAN|nr:hypothetical protein LR48_Vigan05g083300 [Vigna angularis]